MSLPLLFDHLDDLVRTPEDVARLEAAILDLAVRGKLVRQEEGDEPAAELVRRIEARRLLLFGDRGLVASAAVDSVDNLPSGWIYVQLDRIATIGTGSTPNRGEPKYYRNGDIPWITSALTGSPYISQPSEYITELALKETNCKVFPKHTLIVALYGQGKTRGQVSELLIEAATNQACAAIVFASFSEELQPYIKLFFQKYYEELRSLAEGGAQPNLNVGKIKTTSIPLPPLAEQRRIVAKVDELLVQTRALAANLRRAQGEIVTANQAALHRLASAEDGQSLQRAWHTLAGSFDLLYDDPRPLAALRQAILQLAVRGKLVWQEEGDEPALPSIAEATGPYALPAGWKWAEIDAICSHVVDCPHSTAKFINEGNYYCLDTTCIDQGMILYDRVRRVSEATFNERIKRLRPKSGDILFSREGSIGLTVIVPEGMNVCLGQRMMLFRPSQLVTSEYLRYALISDVFVQQWHTQRTGTAAQHVNVGTLRRALIPLPPLAEQRRIVAKVDELLAMCDALEQGLGQAAAAQRAALEAVLARV